MILRHKNARVHQRTVGILAAIAVATLGIAGCSAEPSDNTTQGEIVITCASCQEGEDVFLQYNYDAATRFNEQYAGKYRVETIANQNAAASDERLSYYQRLALADDLPDVFLLSNQEMKVLLESAELHDFNAALDADDAWKSSYYEDSLASLAIDGRQYGIPEVRDVVGIYANQTILKAAGITEFPATWDELEDQCVAIKAAGETCLAMDGNWVTLLMWANLIETHPDGAGFLSNRIGANDWADDPAVIAATERLRSWHEKGFVNSDSLSGEYSNAATIYQTGHAAFVANGPWMMPDIKGTASADGLGDATTYNASPGWSADRRGIISITGGAWVSGSKTAETQEATAAFMKFLASSDEAFAQTIATGSYPAVETELTADQEQQLDPVIANAVAETASLPLHYPNVAANASATFSTSWLNLWPAYIQGELTTDEFLTQLTDDLAGR